MRKLTVAAPQMACSWDADDNMGHWQRAMQDHATANLVPFVASNRGGTDVSGEMCCDFYGSSLIRRSSGGQGGAATRTDETRLTATFDLDAIQDYRRARGIFRDGRSKMCAAVRMLDGVKVAG